jgi:uroporphyrinogen-III synthase
VTLPKPENDKSPYYDLAKKYGLKLDFRGFIHVEGVPAKDVRRDKVNLADYSAVIFTSRNAVDHYFRICEEMRFEVSAEMKYFCISETIALYLQKYIQYRKRKIFFGKQTAKDLEEVLKKHKGRISCSLVRMWPMRKQVIGYNKTAINLHRLCFLELL